MVAQMLDLFADENLKRTDGGSDIPIEEACICYDISNIEKTEYSFGMPANPRIRMHWGGIRKTLFNTNNGLTKAALIFLDGTLEPFVRWHHTQYARIADISAVLLHYPFAGPFYEKVKDAVKTGRYGYFTTREYYKYWEVLKHNPALTIKRDCARKLEGVDALVEEDFLVISDSYRRWTEMHAKCRHLDVDSS
jgi:hypothetical protein